jgi:hypothetical protein
MMQWDPIADHKWENNIYILEYIPKLKYQLNDLWAAEAEEGSVGRRAQELMERNFQQPIAKKTANS